MINSNNKGFGLVELIIYISIASVLLLSISSFYSTILKSRNRNNIVLEVDQQGVYLMNVITQTVRNAELINSPFIGSSDAILSLNTLEENQNPIIFDLFDNVVRIKEGSGDYIPLTNSHIIISNLNFTNLSKTETPGIIRIEFTISYNSSNPNAEYDYTKTFYNSASLR